MKKIGLLFFLLFVSLVSAYIAYEYATLYPGDQENLEGYTFQLDDVEEHNYSYDMNFDTVLYFNDSYDMSSTPPWTVSIDDIVNSSGTVSVILNFYYGGTTTLAATETIDEGDTATVSLPGDEIEVTAEDINPGYTFGSKWAQLHMVNEESGSTYSAIVSVIGTSDNILKKDKISENQTKEFNLGDDGINVEAVEVHYDPVLSSRYARLRLMMVEKDESIKVTVNLADYLSTGGATIYMYDADTEEMLYSDYAEHGKNGQFELPIDDEYVYFYANVDGTEYGGSDYTYRGHTYGDERKVCTATGCTLVSDDYSHTIVLHTEEEEESVECTDTDGGMNRNVRGTVTCLVDDAVLFNSTDYCLGTNSLYEYYYTAEVSGDEYHGASYTCLYGCVDGACLSEPSEEPEEIEEEPEPEPLPPPELSGENYTVNLSAGWNMISIPYSYESWSSDCDGLTYDDTWGYDTRLDRYVHPSEFELGKGYWVPVESDCSIVLEDISDAYSLEGEIIREGWNFLGVGLETISLDYFEETCSIKRGPWIYDPGLGRYGRATTFEPSKGYFVKVEKDCTIGVALPPPPT